MIESKGWIMKKWFHMSWSWIYLSVGDKTLFWCMGYFDISGFVFSFSLFFSLFFFTKVYDLGLFFFFSFCVAQTPNLTRRWEYLNVYRI